MLEVFNPTGSTSVSMPYAKRLKTMEGKHVALLSNGIWQSLRTLPLLQEALQKKFPSARFSIVPANAQIQDDKVMDSIVEMEYDAVIVGNAA